MKEVNNSNYQTNSFVKIRSKYILQKILNNLKKDKLLEMIRYNKSLKSKLNKSIRDYFLEYSKIIIEIIPKENKYGQFININNKYKSYYHIYIDNNLKEESNKYSIDKNEKINKIKIILDYDVISLSKLFKYQKNKFY